MVHEPSDRPDRSDRRVALILILIALVDLAHVFRAPQLIGIQEDDGIYLVTARSLAEGQGYRHLQLPGEPFQTKYPILYPFALSLIWRRFGEFPANVAAMQTFNACCAAVAAWFGYLLLRRTWNLPVWLAGCGAALALGHPACVQLIRSTMSEHLYAALSLAALLVLGERLRTGREDRETARHLRRPVAAALLASLAFLTRTIGVTAVVAVLVTCVLRRSRRSLVAAALAAAIVIAAWEARQWSAKRANAEIAQAAAFGYELDYSNWLVDEIDSRWRVVVQNTAGIAYAFFFAAVMPSKPWSIEAVQEGGTNAVLFYAGVVLAVICCVAGFVSAWQRSRPQIHLYLLLYFGLVWVWPSDPPRFMIPLLPLLIPCFLLGLLRIGRLIHGLWGKRSTPPGVDSSGEETMAGPPRTRSAEPVPSSMLLVVILLFAWYELLHVGMVRSEPDRALQSARRLLAQTIEQQTPPDAVIAFYNAGYYYLTTGRKVVRTLVIEDPVASFYPPDSKFRHMGLTTSPGRARASRRLLEERFESYRRAVGITHVVEIDGDRGFNALFHRFLKDHGYQRRLVATAGPIHLYTLFPPESGWQARTAELAGINAVVWGE